MTLPATGPTTGPAVLAQLGATERANAELAAAAEGCSAAVNTWVRTLPMAARLDALPIDVEWPSSITLGALMLAARLVRRRDTPAGVAVFGDAGALYVQRNDPDVALLLQLGPYAKPSVG